MLSYLTQNTVSKPLNRRLTPLSILALLLSIVLGSAVMIVSQEPTNGHAVNDTEHFPRLVSLLFLVRGSSADNADAAKS